MLYLGEKQRSLSKKISHNYILYIFSNDYFGPKTSLTLPLFLEVSVPSQESGWSCMIIDFSSFYNSSLQMMASTNDGVYNGAIAFQQ